jgi:hypothetical protein
MDLSFTRKSRQYDNIQDLQTPLLTSSRFPLLHPLAHTSCQSSPNPNIHLVLQTPQQTPENHIDLFIRERIEREILWWIVRIHRGYTEERLSSQKKKGEGT